MAAGFPARSSREESFELSTEVLAAAVEVTFDELGWKFGKPGPHTFKGGRGMDLLSWGEKITVEVDAGTVWIESRCHGIQVFDWGKNRRNVDTFLGRLTRVLADAAEAP